MGLRSHSMSGLRGCRTEKITSFWWGEWGDWCWPWNATRWERERRKRGRKRKKEGESLLCFPSSVVTLSRFCCLERAPPRRLPSVSNCHCNDGRKPSEIITVNCGRVEIGYYETCYCKNRYCDCFALVPNESPWIKSLASYDTYYCKI